MEHDAAHKLLHALPDTIADLLRLVAADWVDELDLGTLERASSEYVDEDLLQRIGGMVWRVRFRRGRLKDGARPIFCC